MYYLEYDKNTGNIRSCLNYKDDNKSVVEITEQQYIAFIDGTSNITSYEVINVDNIPTLVAKKVEPTPIVVYKTNQLVEITYDADAEIQIKVTNGFISLLAQHFVNDASITNLYITAKDNPMRLEAIIQVDLEQLQTNKETIFEINSIVNKKISIYTVNKRIKFGLQHEQ